VQLAQVLVDIVVADCDDWKLFGHPERVFIVHYFGHVVKTVTPEVSAEDKPQTDQLNDHVCQIEELHRKIVQG